MAPAVITLLQHPFSLAHRYGFSDFSSGFWFPKLISFAYVPFTCIRNVLGKLLRSSSWMPVSTVLKLHHFQTCCTLIMSPLYTSVNWEWIWIPETGFALKNQITLPASYCNKLLCCCHCTPTCHWKSVTDWHLHEVSHAAPVADATSFWKIKCIINTKATG